MAIRFFLNNELGFLARGWRKTLGVVAVLEIINRDIVYGNNDLEYGGWSQVLGEEYSSLLG